MKLIDYLLDHKTEIVAITTSLHVAITHIYLFVCHQGGLRKLWADFLGPNIQPISGTTPGAVNQETKN